MTGPRWLDHARLYLGQREIPGAQHNPLIVRWWGMMKASFRDDETPWCGAFVGGVLAECEMEVVKGGAAARAWLDFGKALDRPAVGCIVVFERGNNGYSGHVGFVVGQDKFGNLMVLGGNQGDTVSIKPFAKARVLGYRWPSVWPTLDRFALPTLDSNGQVSTNEA